MTFAELAAIFLKTYEGNGCARNTWIYYRTQINALDPLLGDKEIETIRPAQLLQALAASGAGKRNATQRGRAVALQQIQKFALDNSLIEKPWLANIPKPSVDNRTRIPTRAETRALMRHATPQFRLIYECLRQSGARPNELCRAQIENYDPLRGVITLPRHKTARKTGKPRLIVVGRKLERLLRLAIRGRKSGPIFRTRRGHPWTVKNLTTQYGRLRDQAGLDPELVLYSARHEAGTEFCAKHGILVASRMLGHATINTTQRYVHPDVEALRDAQDAADLP